MLLRSFIIPFGSSLIGSTCFGSPFDLPFRLGDGESCGDGGRGSSSDASTPHRCRSSVYDSRISKSSSWFSTTMALALAIKLASIPIDAACEGGKATRKDRDFPAYVLTLELTSVGRTGGEDTSSDGFALEGDWDCAREVGDPTTLSETKARSFFGVPWTEDESPSLVLLMLITLLSVRERPSIRRATLDFDLSIAREGPGAAVSIAKEKIWDKSFASLFGDGERGLSSTAGVVALLETDVRGGVVGREGTEGVGERASIGGLVGFIAELPGVNCIQFMQNSARM